MESFSEIIAVFGTDTLAAALGINLSHVRAMKTRDSIPPEYWARLIDAAREHRVTGITYAKLCDLRAARFERAS